MPLDFPTQMSSINPINQTLLTILDNQIARTDATFQGLRDDVFAAEPGGDCNSILDIGRHLLGLRRFGLSLLQSPFQEQIDDPDSVVDLNDLLTKLASATDLLAKAITDHDPEDWYKQPPVEEPRPGMWGDEATILRLVRPLNDFTNHLGAIRAIRRIQNNPAERTQ